MAHSVIKPVNQQKDACTDKPSCTTGGTIECPTNSPVHRYTFLRFRTITAVRSRLKSNSKSIVVGNSGVLGIGVGDSVVCEEGDVVADGIGIDVGLEVTDGAGDVELEGEGEGFSVKAAVTVLLLSIVIVVLAAPEASPLQLVNDHPALGVALKVTFSPDK
jgi:hypothetical protein